MYVTINLDGDNFLQKITSFYGLFEAFPPTLCYISCDQDLMHEITNSVAQSHSSVTMLLRKVSTFYRF